MALKKENIQALVIPDDLKKDLLELFGEIETKETALTAMRAKMPTDSQKVVEGVDYEAFQKATSELATLKAEMASKLNDEKAGHEGQSILSVFSPFFGE